MTSPQPIGYSGISSFQAQSRPCRSLIAVVTKILVWPASIFCRVRIFRSANSASRSCVILRATRSRRRLAPKVLICRIVLLLDTPYHAAIVATSERHDMP